MPFDAGIIVGYLAAALGKQVADRAIKGLLDRLAALVAGKLGRPPLDELAHRPDDPAIRAYLDDAIRRAARADPAFGRDLDRLGAELDRRGARTVIHEISAPYGQVAVGSNPVAIGSLFASLPQVAAVPAQTTRSPGWTKVIMGLGGLLCLTGIGTFGYTALTYEPPLGDTSTPAGIKAGMGIFFIGFVLAILGGVIGAALARPRR